MLERRFGGREDARVDSLRIELRRYGKDGALHQEIQLCVVESFRHRQIAGIAAGPVIETPSATATHDPGSPGPSRAPPRRDSIRPRAPPA